MAVFFPTSTDYPILRLEVYLSQVTYHGLETNIFYYQDLGWSADDVENLPPQYSYTKIECWMQGVRDYIKYIKRGYSRPSQMSAVDLRDGSINLVDAQKIIDDWECIEPFALNFLLEYLDMSSEEFYSLCTTHSISPWSFSRPIFVRILCHYMIQTPGSIIRPFLNLKKTLLTLKTVIPLCKYDSLLYYRLRLWQFTIIA